MFIDADERVSPELAGEIVEKLDRPENAWAMPRHNWIFGKLTLGAGWFPDYQTRLIRKNFVTYDPRYPVHEIVIAVGDVGYLTKPLKVDEFMDTLKMALDVGEQDARPGS